MEEIVVNSIKKMNKVNRVFQKSDQPGILKIANRVKEELDEFKPFVPVALALRREGMYERHWEQISEKVGFKVSPDANFTFQTVIDMELIKWKDDLEEIGERASQEYNIETTLNNMIESWKEVEFNMIPFKKTETFTCTGFDDAMMLLDE